MDTHFFQQQMLKLTDGLYRFALFRLGRKEDAEDAVQDTFMRMWQMGARLKQYDRLDFLAFHILRNLCIDRARKRRPDQTDEPVYLDKMADTHTPYRKMEAREALRQVEMAARQLPEQQRTILFLRNVEGYSNKEIAEMLDLKLNTVEVNLSRARRRLRQIFKNKTYGRATEYQSTFGQIRGRADLPGGGGPVDPVF